MKNHDSWQKPPAVKTRRLEDDGAISNNPELPLLV